MKKPKMVGKFPDCHLRLCRVEFKGKCRLFEQGKCLSTMEEIPEFVDFKGREK